jgi:hypothetical protein
MPHAKVSTDEGSPAGRWYQANFEVDALSLADSHGLTALLEPAQKIRIETRKSTAFRSVPANTSMPEAAETSLTPG